MSQTIQPLMKGTQHSLAKGDAPKGPTNFEKLISKLVDGNESQKKEVQDLLLGEMTDEALPDTMLNENPLLQGLSLGEKVEISPQLKQLLFANPQGKGAPDVGIHGFTKEELLEFESSQQKSLITSQSKVKEESAIEGKLKVLNMLEQMEPSLSKQDVQQIVKRASLDVAMTGSSLNQEVATVDVQVTEDNKQLQIKPMLSESLPQTAVKEETPVLRARQFTSDFGQFLEQMQVMKNGKESQLRIKLSPENLGQLDIRLTTNDGKLTAHIATTTTAAKEMIEGQLHQLRQTFVQQGIQLDKIEVVQQSSQSLLQDGQQGQQQFNHGKQQQGKKSGHYEVEENPVVTHEQEETTGINYSV